MEIKFLNAVLNVIEKKHSFIWEKRDALFKDEPRTREGVIRVFSRLFVLASIIFFLFGAKEILIGDEPVFSKTPNGAVCNDGWRSNSQGPGTCSHHGGVDYYVYEDVNSGIDYSNPLPFFVALISILFIIIIISIFYKSFRWAVYKYFFDIFYFTSIITFGLLSFLLFLPMILFAILHLYIDPLIKLFSKNKP
jgi:hypothetical protein